MQKKGGEDINMQLQFQSWTKNAKGAMAEEMLLVAVTYMECNRLVMAKRWADSAMKCVDKSDVRVKEIQNIQNILSDVNPSNLDECDAPITELAGIDQITVHLAKAKEDLVKEWIKQYGSNSAEKILKKVQKEIDEKYWNIRPVWELLKQLRFEAYECEKRNDLQAACKKYELAAQLGDPISAILLITPLYLPFYHPTPEEFRRSNDATKKEASMTRRAHPSEYLPLANKLYKAKFYGEVKRWAAKAYVHGIASNDYMMEIEAEELLKQLEKEKE